MTEVRFSTKYPILPDPDSSTVNFQAAVRGSDLQGMGNTANFLKTYKFRHLHNCHVETDITGTAAPVDALIWNSPSGVNKTHKLIFRADERAQYYAVVFQYQVVRGTGAGSAVVDASLRAFPGGAFLDQGIRWDQDRGDLVPERTRRVSVGLATYDERPGLFAGTGELIDDTPAGFPTRPRLLNIGTGAGADVELRLVTQNCRIWGFSVIEYFLGQEDKV
jgi:hypothetical protein